MSFFKKLFGSKTKKRTNLYEVQEVYDKLIVSGYRRIGEQYRLAPTGKTSDQKIIEIYSRVVTAFRQASEQRREHIPALILNFIVFKFLQVYEMMGDQMLQEHLQYEVEKYLEEGLRPDYRQELPLF
ncbi:MAG: hypothetical protein Kow0042_02850 [Calditrichia bacterium]